MTPIFCCGFECGQLGNVGQHVNASAHFSISTTTVRSGARSLRANPVTATGNALAVTVFSSTIGVARVYVYFNTLPSGVSTFVDIVAFQTSGSILVGAARF